MALTLVDFWKRLLDSGLADPTQPPLWAKAYAVDHSSTPPSDPLQLAKWLVATDRIPAMAASECLAESWPAVPRLRIAPVTRAGLRGGEPFARYVPVRIDAAARRPAHADVAPSLAHREGWLLALPADQLQATDGDQLRRHAAIEHPQLAAVQLIPLPQGSLSSVAELRSPPASSPPPWHRPAVGWLIEPAPGQTLRQLLDPSSSHFNEQLANPSPAELATRLSDLAGALAALHTAGLVAGRIDPAVVWRDVMGNLELLRDPGAYLSDSVLAAINASQRVTLESPEETWASEAPTATDDLVNLARLGVWWRYQPATLPRPGELPHELAEAMRQGAAGDPLNRVLAHSLHQDPAARFPNAESFAAALAAAATVMATQPVTGQPASPPAPAKSPPTKVPAKPIAPVQPVIATAPAAANLAEESTPSRPTPKQPTRPPAPPTLPDSATPPESSPGAKITPSPAATFEPPTRPESLGEERPPEPELRSRSRRRRNQNAIYVLGGLCVPVLVLMIAVLVHDPTSQRQAAKRIRPPQPAVLPSITKSSRPTPPSVNRSPTPRVPAPPASSGSVELVENGEMLWAPPEATLAGVADQKRAPLTALLPPGPAAVASFHLPHLRQTGLLDDLSTEISPWLERLQSWAGVPLEQIERVGVAVFPGSGGTPEVSLAIHLKSPVLLGTLTDAWQASPGRAPSGVTLYTSGEVNAPAYFPATDNADPSNPMVTSFAVGPMDQIAVVAEVEGAPVVLPRLLEELWASAHVRDAAAVLTQPNFLVADARNWTTAISPKLVDWVRRQLIPPCGGVLLRVASAIDPTGRALPDALPSYVEWRLAASPGIDPAVLADRINDQLASAPSVAEEFFVTRDVDPSWRLLASRLPSMWSFVVDQTRRGRQERELIWNAYLPPSALGQWTVGTLLAINTTGETVVASEPTQPTETLTVAQMLDRPMSISFDQESLQFAVDTIANQFADDLPQGNVMPPIVIIGGDLQKNGITQNQQVRDFKKTNLPLRQVLTDLVLGANPDRTATGPADPKQSLIWVVTEGDAGPEIRITTREAAAGKYELPPEFVKSG